MRIVFLQLQTYHFAVDNLQENGLVQSVNMLAHMFLNRKLLFYSCYLVIK